MQHVLVDHARRHFRKKRGDGAGHLVLEEATALTEPQLEQVLIIDDALRRLEKEDARRADVFRMRFFSGLAVREVAEAMNLSENTVIRDWSAACSYLREQIQGKHRQAV
jgi:RNA polymerase sigma factor (TIGR02999 family)